PGDFGKGVVTWTIKANGKTQKAYGELMPVEEITERIVMTRGNLNPGDDDPNKPPTITVAPSGGATVDVPITLTAIVTDDGLPKPRAPAPVRTPPTRDATTIQAQANSSGGGPRRGLNVTWMELRGPAKVRFEPSGPINVADGKAVATARFSQRGRSGRRGTASAGALATKTDVTITAGGGS